ncbi:hypothetical protein GW915_04080 [bacterium]|nr:hypothetical protein [bacterium]
MSELYVRIIERNIPLDADGNILVDLYILMPASRRYVPFVKVGDPYSSDKRAQLKRHVLPDLFILPSELNEAVKIAANKDKLEFHKDGEFKYEVLGVEAEDELKDIYKALLLNEEQDPQDLLSSLQTSSDKILSIVAPDSKELTKIFFSNAKYINLMNDSAAVSSLAVMFAYANGFDSKKSYLELTQAALVMDVSLSQIDEDYRRKMYMEPDSLPDEIKTLIHEHPKKSFQLVQQKVPSLSEVTMQLILNHHELFNGKGFPRAVRSESLFPLVKILSLAVDVHHQLKKHQYEGSLVDLSEIVFNIHHSDVEAHLRRHNRTVTQKILDFFDSHQADAA